MRRHGPSLHFKMCSIALPVAAAIATVMMSCAALAEGDELASCQKEEAPPAERLAACDKLIDDAAQADEIRAEAMLNRGQIRETQGKRAEAIADFARAIELNPAYPAPYLNRGMANEEAGNIDAALADFSEVLKLEPADVATLFLRAELLFHAGRLDASLADYKHILEIDPEDADAYVGCGEVALTAADNAKAAENFKKALEKDPSNERAKAGLERLGAKL